MRETNLESDLIAQAVAGDRVALGKLLLAHYEPLRHHVSGHLPARFERILSVDDIMQQTFAAAFAGIGALQCHSSASFSAWLRTIAENQLKGAVEALNAQKRGGGRRQVAARASALVSLANFLSDRADTPQRTAAGREAAEAVDLGLNALPSAQRQAVRLHHFDGRTLQQTAAVMDRSPNAVRGLLQRAKAALRDAMGRSSRWFSRK